MQRSTGSALDAERTPHERVDATEVRVGPGREVAGRRPADAVRGGGERRRAEAELAGVEDVASGVAVDELERLAGGHDGRVPARIRQREVALAIEEAADVDLVRPRPVGQRRRA